MFSSYPGPFQKGGVDRRFEEPELENCEYSDPEGGAFSMSTKMTSSQSPGSFYELTSLARSKHFHVDSECIGFFGCELETVVSLRDPPSFHLQHPDTCPWILTKTTSEHFCIRSSFGAVEGAEKTSLGHHVTEIFRFDVLGRPSQNSLGCNVKVTLSEHF